MPFLPSGEWPPGTIDLAVDSKTTNMTPGHVGTRTNVDVLDATIHFFYDWFNTQLLPGPVPRTLYHYTDTLGTESILRSRRLWASNALYLNDANEVQHTLHLVETLVGASDSPADRVMKEATSSFFRFLQVYVACFCACGDLLSQWRGYGPSSGYALGVNVKPLLAQNTRRLLLVKCIYDLARQEETLQNLLRRFRDTLSQFPELKEGTEAWNVATVLFAEAVSLVAMKFKHSAFSEELEWRLVYRRSEVGMNPDPDPEVLVRVRHDLLLPYIALPPEQDIELHEVVIGPSRYPDHAGHALRLLLDTFGLDKVSISQSTVPLRAGW